MLRRLGLVLLIVAAACAAPPAPAADDPPAANLALQGTRWVMRIDDAPPRTEAPTLEFSAEGRAGGFTGCNQWFAQIEQANGGLSFHSVGVTRRACEAPAMDIERAFSESLAHTRSAQRDGDDLILFGEEAEQLARFMPAA